MNKTEVNIKLCLICGYLIINNLSVDTSLQHVEETQEKKVKKLQGVKEKIIAKLCRGHNSSLINLKEEELPQIL